MPMSEMEHGKAVVRKTKTLNAHQPRCEESKTSKRMRVDCKRTRVNAALLAGKVHPPSTRSLAHSLSHFASTLQLDRRPCDSRKKRPRPRASGAVRIPPTLEPWRIQSAPRTMFEIVAGSQIFAAVLVADGSRGLPAGRGLERRRGDYATGFPANG